MSASDHIRDKADSLKDRARTAHLKDRVDAVARRAPSSNELKDFAFRYGPRVHKALIAASGGKLSRFSGMPIIELRTTGRKSGLPRATMLTSPIHDDDKVVIVASKGGDTRNPEWFLNLEADPDVEVIIDGQAKKMRARVASPAEKAEMWPRIVSRYKGYGSYQKRTERSIPVVICESPLD